MLRIKFTAEDLGRVRVAPSVDPMWELVLSAHQLQGRRQIVFDGWLDHAGGKLRQRSVYAAARILSTLAPVDRYFPDFLTPPGVDGGFDAGLDAVLSTPRRRLRHELGRLATRRRLPAWVERLASAERKPVSSLGRALGTYYQALVHPYLPQIDTTVGADRAQRSHAALRGGTEGLLTSLGPTMRWRPPELEVDYPIDVTRSLDGQGLTLVPSYFCWQTPVALADPSLPLTVVYPVRHHFEGADHPPGEPVGALLGSTRAAVLDVIGTGATTSHIARRVGISPATASHHATVLRNAGLTTTERQANHVFHSLTPLGADLLARA